MTTHLERRNNQETERLSLALVLSAWKRSPDNILRCSIPSVINSTPLSLEEIQELTGAHKNNRHTATHERSTQFVGDSKYHRQKTRIDELMLPDFYTGMAESDRGPVRGFAVDMKTHITNEFRSQHLPDDLIVDLQDGSSPSPTSASGLFVKADKLEEWRLKT